MVRRLAISVSSDLTRELLRAANTNSHDDEFAVRGHPRAPVIGSRHLTSWTLRVLNLDPERAAANAAPTTAQRRCDRADQLAAILRRFNTRERPAAEYRHSSASLRSGHA